MDGSEEKGVECSGSQLIREICMEVVLPSCRRHASASNSKVLDTVGNRKVGGLAWICAPSA